MPPPTISDATYRKIMGTDPPPPAKREKAKRSGPNGLEAKFAKEVLDLYLAAGDIHDYKYEPFTLKVLEVESDGPHQTATKYTPDWVAWHKDGSLYVYETKGFERSKDFLRFKMAAAQYPQWRFVWVTWDKAEGMWKFERFYPEGRTNE